MAQAEVESEKERQLVRRRDMADTLFEFVRNDVKFYKSTSLIRKKMEDGLRAGTYDIRESVKAFSKQMDTDKLVDQLADVIDAENDGDKTEGYYIRSHWFMFRTDASRFLEEYYRHEACLMLKLTPPYVHCVACKKALTAVQHNEAYSERLDGIYCSAACYDVLFANCSICGDRNMTCVTNAKEPFIDGAALESSCDSCLLKKYNLSIVVISTL